MYEFRGARRYKCMRKESRAMAEKPRVRPVVRKEALLIFRTLSGVPGPRSVWEMKQEPWPCLTWGGRGTGKVAVAKPVQASAKPYHISQAGVMSKKILRLWPLGGERPWHLHSETLRPGMAALIRVQLCLPSLQPVCVLVPDLCCALETPLISHLGCV